MTATNATPARLTEGELERFAGNLQLARTMYRARPDLVTARHYPSELAPFFREGYGHNPSDTERESVPSLERVPPARGKGGPLISSGLTGTIDAHGECLKGFAAFLDKCDNLTDLQTMALVFRVYGREHNAGGWVGEAVQNVLLDTGIRLAAGDAPEDITSLLDGCPDSKYSPASGISSHLKPLLGELDHEGLEFVAGLLKAIHEASGSAVPRAAVAQYLQSLDAPRVAASRRESHRAKGGKRAA
jgi:hypothetical protein